jgi:hypothetical protein
VNFTYHGSRITLWLKVFELLIHQFARRVHEVKISTRGHQVHNFHDFQLILPDLQVIPDLGHFGRIDNCPAMLGTGDDDADFVDHGFLLKQSET